MKKKINLSKLKAAGQDASMQMYQEVSHAKQEVDQVLIDIDKIYENPYQPRIYVEENTLQDLADSIGENGLLQPISLNRIDENKYFIIAGHRRFAAHKLLGKDKIKANIVSSLKEDDEDYKIKMAGLSLVENIQREDLNIIEVAISFENVLKEKIYQNMDHLAKSIGKSKSYISKIISILKLDPYIVADIGKNKTVKDLETLYELQKIEDIELQIKLYEEIIKGNLSRNDLREYVKNLKQVSQAKHTKPFELKVSSKKIILNTNLDYLSDKKKEDFSYELNRLLDKYFIK